MRRLLLIPVLLLAVTACAGDTASPGTTSVPTTVAGALPLDPAAPPTYPASVSSPVQSTDNAGREWAGPAYPIEAGGPIDVSSLGTPGCVGWARRAPDVTETIAAGRDLEIFFGNAPGDKDTALVVLGPAGDWSCADDSEYGINPMVLFPNAAPGEYKVWVAVKQEGATIAGTLTLSSAATP